MRSTSIRSMRCHLPTGIRSLRAFLFVCFDHMWSKRGSSSAGWACRRVPCSRTMMPASWDLWTGIGKGLVLIDAADGRLFLQVFTSR